MIVKILPKPSKNFAGVNYNTNKIDRNKGELMRAANFGPLDALSNLRPQDYINYFRMISAQNKRIHNPQFHAVLSAKGKSYNKDELTQLAVDWLTQMGYGNQPYLIVFHKDTDNNHVHVVSTRVGKDGKKINSAYEHVRAINTMNQVLGYSYAQQYGISTQAQFYLLIEKAGYPGRDFDEAKLQKIIDRYQPDKQRAENIKQLFLQLREEDHILKTLRDQHQIELIFHSAEGKKPYGYTIIDHDTKQVFKGSEVLGLKYLLGERELPAGYNSNESSSGSKNNLGEDHYKPEIYIGPIFIANDVDDQQVLGMKRRRQKKARTNTR